MEVVNIKWFISPAWLDGLDLYGCINGLWQESLSVNANIDIGYNKQIIFANEDLNMSLVFSTAFAWQRAVLSNEKNNTGPNKIKDNFVWL